MTMNENPEGSEIGNDIGWAVKQLLRGRSVRRPAWFGELFICIEMQGPKRDQPRLLKINPKRFRSMGYKAPPEDLFAEDWELA